MPVPSITVKDALEHKNALFIDTRSPSEHELDHIPGAINIPIFDDDQRAKIGTLYKEDKKAAFELGHRLYDEKVAKLLKEVKTLDTSKKIIVFCWRGGLRSETITKLIIENSIDALQLEGGYKSFREFIRIELHNYLPKFKFIVLHGLAGCGKTDLIKKLNPSIDLEGIARHRSSVFGAIGLEPNNQKNFETQLYFLVKKFEKEKFVFIEGESHKVGRVFIPPNIFAAMKQGISVRINASTEKRVQRIVNDYFTHGEDKNIVDIINTLRQALTNKVTDELIDLVKSKNYAKVSKVLLLDYYDSRYEHFMRDVNYDHTIVSDDLEKAVGDLEVFAQSL